MSAPASVFVTFHENGSPAVVSEYRDEAEAQNGQPATEYVTDASASHAATISDRIQARMQAGLEQLIVEKDAALAELTRLRAALESIAALQTEAPADTSEETGERFDSLRDAYECGEMDGYRDGQWEAAEMARKALVSK